MEPFGRFRFSCESGRAAGDDFAEVQRVILSRIRRSADFYLPAELNPPLFPEAPDSSLLGMALSAWARVCSRLLVLFFDESDSLQGRSPSGREITVLRA